MNAIFPKQANEYYSNRHTAKPVHFFHHAPRAQFVCLIGDFNDWNPGAHPMQRQLDGTWFLEVPLPHGHHQYLFLVDGKSTPDAHAMGAVRNERGQIVSLIAVS